MLLDPVVPLGLLRASSIEAQPRKRITMRSAGSISMPTGSVPLGRRFFHMPTSFA
jgi:hypothetical protein